VLYIIVYHDFEIPHVALSDFVNWLCPTPSIMHHDLRGCSVPMPRQPWWAHAACSTFLASDRRRAQGRFAYCRHVKVSVSGATWLSAIST